MKRLITTLLLIIVVTVANAQNLSDIKPADPVYDIYEVEGEVVNVKGKSAVTRQQTVSSKEVLSIPEGGMVKLLDRQSRKLFTLRGKCSGSIVTLIESQKGTEKNLSKTYFAYILKRLGRADTDRVYDTGITTGTFRHDADSLLCDIDSLQNVVDSLRNVIKSLSKDTVKP